MGDGIVLCLTCQQQTKKVNEVSYELGTNSGYGLGGARIWVQNSGR